MNIFKVLIFLSVSLCASGDIFEQFDQAIQKKQKEYNSFQIFKLATSYLNVLEEKYGEGPSLGNVERYFTGKYEIYFYYLHNKLLSDVLSSEQQVNLQSELSFVEKRLDKYDIERRAQSVMAVWDHFRNIESSFYKKYGENPLESYDSIKLSLGELKKLKSALDKQKKLYMAPIQKRMWKIQLKAAQGLYLTPADQEFLKKYQKVSSPPRKKKRLSLQ